MDDKKFEQGLKLLLSKCNICILHPLDKEELYKFLIKHLDSYDRVNVSQRVLRENYPDLSEEIRDWFQGFLDCILLHKGIIP